MTGHSTKSNISLLLPFLRASLVASVWHEHSCKRLIFFIAIFKVNCWECCVGRRLANWDQQAELLRQSCRIISCSFSLELSSGKGSQCSEEPKCNLSKVAARVAKMPPVSLPQESSELNITSGSLTLHCFCKFYFKAGLVWVCLFCTHLQDRECNISGNFQTF